MDAILHHLETMVETIVCWHLEWESSETRVSEVVRDSRISSIHSISDFPLTSDGLPIPAHGASVDGGRSQPTGARPHCADGQGPRVSGSQGPRAWCRGLVRTFFVCLFFGCFFPTLPLTNVEPHVFGVSGLDHVPFKANCYYCFFSH